MLIEFSIGNYRSFKDKVTFSMKAANIVAQDTKTDEHNTLKHKNLTLNLHLEVCLIYSNI